VKLNLGSGQNIQQTAINVDRHIPNPWMTTSRHLSHKTQDAIRPAAACYSITHPHQPTNATFIKHNLDQHPWPFESDSATRIQAHHVVEHLRHPIQALNEAHRILQNDGNLDLRLPLAGTPEQHNDPTHRTSWTPASFDFLDADADPDYRPTNHLWDIHKLTLNHSPANPWYAWHAREWLGLELGRPTEIQAVLSPDKI
jgi:SAM-dependent methyltransferase